MKIGPIPDGIDFDIDRRYFDEQIARGFAVPPEYLKTGADVCAIAQSAYQYVPSAVIEESLKWERRAIAWAAENWDKDRLREYPSVLQAYRVFGIRLAGCEGRTPVYATLLYTAYDKKGWASSHYATLKEALEDLLRRQLPDIDPSDALELGKSTPWSAEDWWRGCTDRAKWD